MKSLLVLLSSLLLWSSVQAGPVNTQGWGNNAIEGYDPVAYFTESKPVRGDSDYSYKWQGANWRFSSAENRERFIQNPTAYAPQYGGYCAYAVANNYTASIDPSAWTIVDGKLYLNYSKSVQKTWSRDIPGYIQKGNKHWPELKETL
ncbi:YHS domain-containing (seleno)protein [Motiliproteus sp.]|uniref:YHS domain-containing (seleno)protein n=1 Tax=Motiliproteus sp. TaxID=1898955 RepID=UPI003BACA67B